MPLAALSRKQIGAFCAALKDRLFDRASNFGKEYLRLLVDEIKVVKKEVHLSGSFQLWQVHFVWEQNMSLQRCPVLA